MVHIWEEYRNSCIAFYSGNILITVFINYQLYVWGYGLVWFQLYEQYEDTEIGALDNEDVDGYVGQGSHMLDTILEDFEKQQENKWAHRI